MKKIFLQSALVLSAIAGLLAFAGCDTAVEDDKLAVPSNLEISVVGRWFNVSWDAVEGASGYIVYTNSVGCASGNRIVNTATVTAADHEGTAVNSLFPANGSVEFPTATSIRIWLMPNGMPMNNSSDNTREVMATEVSAKVKAVNINDASHDSDYSAERTVTKAHYQSGS
jgi:uncharacterized lipoprotein NlpE involved in copper resistance